MKIVNAPEDPNKKDVKHHQPDAQEKAAKQELHKDATTSQQSPIKDNATASAHARETFGPTPRNMSYSTDRPGGLSGKEYLDQNTNTRMLIGDNNQLYRG